MPEPKITPNPFSPYANADPEYRHLLASLFGIAPKPGVLALAACERMAVTPEETLKDATDALSIGDLASLPQGMCTPCMLVASGRADADRLAPQECRECESSSSQGAWCALCRQELHNIWWATRGQEPARG
jgi:hypothetical protein